MTEPSRSPALYLPWTTIFKVLAAVALVFVWPRISWVFLLILIALIVAVGLARGVEWLEAHRWPRWTAPPPSS